MQDLGRKFEAADVTEELREEAFEFTRNYQGNFEFMLSMQSTLSRYNDLSDNQVKGVLNVMRAEQSRKQRAATTTNGSAEGVDLSALPEGRYAVRQQGEEIRFFKVTKPGEKTRWAGTIFVDQVVGGRPETRFSGGRQNPGGKYNGKFLKDLQVVVADSKAAMQLYGFTIGCCGVCNATLTDEDSRRIGIGPICRGRFGL